MLVVRCWLLRLGSRRGLEGRYGSSRLFLRGMLRFMLLPLCGGSWRVVVVVVVVVVMAEGVLFVWFGSCASSYGAYYCHSYTAE